MQTTATHTDDRSMALLSRLAHLFSTEHPWYPVVGIAAIALLIALLTRPSVVGPVHVDEWTNLAYAETLAAEQAVPHPDPLFGESEIDYRPETGFRVFLVQLREVTGLDWISLFPLLPASLAALFAATVLALGVSLRTGLFAGVLALGTPTTLRFLGPEFAVPVSLGLILAVTLATVLLAPGFTERSRLGVVPLVMAGLVLAHPPTALVVSVFVGALFVVRLHDNGWNLRGSELKTFLSVAVVPALWFLLLGGELRSELLGQTSVTAGSGQGLITDYMSSAGYLRLLLMNGALFFLLVSGFTSAKIGLIAGLTVMLGFARAHEIGLIGMANLYDRSWLYIDLLLVLAGAAGISNALSMIPVHRLRISHQALRRVSLAVVLLLVVAETSMSRSGTDVYRIAESDRISDFEWIQANLDGVAGLTLLDPDIAIGYPAIAGRPVFASSAFPRPSTEERVDQARQLLIDQPEARDLAALNIGIVYRPGWTSSDDFTEVRPDIYLVDPLAQSTDSTTEGE